MCANNLGSPSPHIKASVRSYSASAHGQVAPTRDGELSRNQATDLARAPEMVGKRRPRSPKATTRIPSAALGISATRVESWKERRDGVVYI